MPGVLPTLGDNGVIPSMWSTFQQQINGVGKVASGVATNPTRFTLDQWGNCNAINGPLNQIIEIGAGYQQYGVQVGTNLTGFGVATPTLFADTTITTTANSTAATVASATGFVSGHVIGAIQVVGAFQEPDTTTAVNNVLTPGTTYTISGTSVTLSEPALISGSGFFCASCLWTQTGSTVHS